MKNITKKILGIVVSGMVLVGFSGCEPKEEFMKQIAKREAWVAMIRSDIDIILRTIPAAVFAEARDPQESPKGFKGWGSFMINNLDLEISGKVLGDWRASGDGIELFVGFDPKMESVNTPITKAISCGVVIWIDTSTGNLHFDPSKLNGSHKYCEALKKSYFAQVIPLKYTKSHW